MTERLTGISSMATRGLLSALARVHEEQGGPAVAIRSVGGVEAARLVRAGEAFDVVVLASPVMEALEREGHVRPASRTDIVRSSMAVAVRSGAPAPSIGSEGELRAAILAASSVHFSTGPSGDRLEGMLTRWGIADAVADRLVQAPPGVPVGALVAERGGLGFQQLSELMGVPGIAIVGTLAPDMASPTIFTAGIGGRADAVEQAEAFIGFLGSAAASALKGRCGFQPN